MHETFVAHARADAAAISHAGGTSLSSAAAPMSFSSVPVRLPPSAMGVSGLLRIATTVLSSGLEIMAVGVVENVGGKLSRVRRQSAPWQEARLDGKVLQGEKACMGKDHLDNVKGYWTQTDGVLAASG